MSDKVVELFPRVKIIDGMRVTKIDIDEARDGLISISLAECMRCDRADLEKVTRDNLHRMYLVGCFAGEYSRKNPEEKS